MIEIGLCQCGCGEKTNLSDRTDKRNSLILGEPRKYLKNHHRRKTVAPLCGYVVDHKSGCWVWMLNINLDGYGEVTIKGKRRKAHIVEYIRLHGCIPHGLELDHLCKNTKCVNPDHLEPVTPTENKRRSSATKLTIEKVSIIKNHKGPYSEMAAMFGVCESNISHIKRGLIWKDVD